MIQDFFSNLSASKIQYVHFKSNLRLARSFCGETDFDVLVRRSDWHKFEKVLIKFGAKPRYGTFNTMYPGVEHWLLYDSDHEQLYHFHVYYDLLFGRGDKKNYHFPNLDFVFAEAVKHPEFDIRVVSPRFELMLLVMRIILKFDPLQRVHKRVLRGYSIPSGMRVELDDLLNKVDRKSFDTWLNTKHPEHAQLILKFINWYCSGKIKNYFAICLLASQLKTCLTTYQRTDEETASSLAKLRKKSKTYAVRWLPAGGMVISLVGADGAGKTTLAKDITQWLNQKLSAKYLYLGQPKARPLGPFQKSIRQFFTRILHPNPEKRKAIKPLAVAKARHAQWRAATYHAGNGWFVVTDRYPLREFREMRFPMDGPRLPSSSAFHQRELRIYDEIAPYPDVLIVLDVDYEIATARKGICSDTEKDRQHKEKVEAVKKLIAGMYAEMIVIDANQDYANVRKQVKKAIWERL